MNRHSIPRKLRHISPQHFLLKDELRPFLFAHRGYSSRAPENSMAAFQACEEAGIPGIELDVHLSADGKVVIVHDHDLQRTAGGKGRVEEKSYQELQNYDIGSWYSRDFAGQRIPLLEDLLSRFGDRFYYDIEMKDETHGDSGLAAAVVEIIQRMGMQDHCFLSSFNPYPLKAAKKAAPKLPTAIIYSTAKDVPPILRRGLGRFIAGTEILKPKYLQAGKTAVSYFRSLEGRPCIPWTVDDRELGKMLLASGVEGLISNDPGLHQ